VPVFSGSDLLAVVERDKDATWWTLGKLRRELDWSTARLLHELANGLPYRTIPEGYTIDWSDPYLRRYLNIEASEISVPSGTVVGAIEPPPHKTRSYLAAWGLTLGIEVLPPTDVSPTPAPPSRGMRKKPTNKPHAVGRPRDYPGEIIQQVARDYIKVYGLPQTQTMLREKVCDECERNGYDVPESTRFKELIAPIFKSPPDFSSDEIGRFGR
jgi:hypothetical protein